MPLPERSSVYVAGKRTTRDVALTAMARGLPLGLSARPPSQLTEVTASPAPATDLARAKDSATDASAPKTPVIAYSTVAGSMLQGVAEDVLDSRFMRKYEGKVQLIFTSPPFPLNRKKKYGNKKGQDYVEWLADLAPVFTRFLAPKGSIVLELGNAWVEGEPVMSVLALEAMLGFLRKGNLNLCQQFICDNPARLPGPIQWVNIERVRVKDSFTHVWWMAPDPRPHADNRQVLKAYSKSMKGLLKRQKYNPGKRPSEHHIGETSFLQNNEGAIPSNVLSYANTNANDDYRKYCLANGIKRHPARMPAGLAEFFIKFLTREGDLVLDPFGGSNTTGSVAEKLKRRWLSIEPLTDYIEGSKGRFTTIRSEAK